MPFVTFHLVEDQVNQDQCKALLEQGAQLYAEVLEAPVERIRGLIRTYPSSHAMVGGRIVEPDSLGAPFFEFVVMADRSEQQIQTITAGFTRLLVEILGADQSLVRGRCIRVNPNDWMIAGKSAAEIRGAEIAARNQSNA